MCLQDWDEREEATMTVLCNPQSPEVECGIAGSGTGSATQPYPKPLLQPGTECRLQSISVEKPVFAVGAACAQTDVRTNVEHLEKNQKQIHVRSDPHNQSHFSHVQSQLGSLAITTTDENKASVQEPHPPHAASATHGQHSTLPYQSALERNLNLDHSDVGPERLFFQPNNRNILTKPLRITAGLNAERGQWNYSLNFKPNVELSSGNFLQANTNHQISVTHLRGHSSGLQNKISSLEIRRLDQPFLQSHPNTNPTGSQSACGGMGSHVWPQFNRDPSLFLTGTGAMMHLQHHHSQQMSPHPGLNWIPQNLQAARFRFVARQGSFSGTHGRQEIGGQPGWRSFQSGVTTTLGRSKSMTDRHTAGFRGVNHNRI